MEESAGKNRKAQEAAEKKALAHPGARQEMRRKSKESHKDASDAKFERSPAKSKTTEPSGARSIYVRTYVGR